MRPTQYAVIAFAAIVTVFCCAQLGLAATQGWLHGRHGVVVYARHPDEFMMTVAINAVAAVFFAAVAVALWRKFQSGADA